MLYESDRRVQDKSIYQTRIRNYEYSGGKKRRMSLEPEEIDFIIREFESGTSRSQIARSLRICVPSVTKYLKANNIYIPPKVRGESKYYPYDGERYRVARLCRVYALIDKKSPRWSRPPRLWVEEIIKESETLEELLLEAKELEKKNF